MPLLTLGQETVESDHEGEKVGEYFWPVWQKLAEFACCAHSRKKV